MSVTSSQPSRKSGRSSVPQKRGRHESTSTPPPPPRLSSLPDRLFLPSIPATPRFSRDPPLVEVSFRQIQVQVNGDFGISFDEDEILDEDQIFLANMVSSQRPKLTESNVRNREILHSSGWIGEGGTKFVHYVSCLPMTHLPPLTHDPVPPEGSRVCIFSGPALAKIQWYLHE